MKKPRTREHRRRGNLPIDMDARLLTPAEVSQRFGVAEQTLANWRSRGRGPEWVKVRGRVGQPGGFVFYDPDKVQAYLDTLKEPTVVVPEVAP